MLRLKGAAEREVNNDHSSNCNNHVHDAERGSSSDRLISTTTPQEELGKVMQVIAHDITMITGICHRCNKNKESVDSDDNDSDDNKKCRQQEQGLICRLVVLPALLRLLSHGIHLLFGCHDSRTSSSSPSHIEARLELCAVAATVAMAFGSPSGLDPRDIMADADSSSNKGRSGSGNSFLLAEEWNNVTKYCSYPPTIPPLKNETNDDCNLFLRYVGHGNNASGSGSDGVIDWDRIALDKTSWIDDGISGSTTLRDVRYLWKALNDSCCGCLAVHGGEDTPSNNTLLSSVREENDDANAFDEKKRLGNAALVIDADIVVQNVCQALGTERMARAVRAHFFARDVISDNAHACGSNQQLNASSKQQQHNTITTIFGAGGTKKETPLLPSERPFETCPSRIHVVIQFMLRVSAASSSPSLPPFLLSSIVISDFLPICYALLDSFRPIHVAMGATLLSRLFVEIMNERSGSDDSSSLLLSMEPFQNAIISVLDLTCRNCRDGPALGLVCMARSRFFFLLATTMTATSSNINSYSSILWQKERRRATGQLLTILQNNSYKEMDQNNGLVLCLLVGGIVPLLHQHAEQQQPIADALEMGRIGLASLLPLLRWDYAIEGRRIQLAALVGLINLFMGTYPIMPRHGGKIMSELLACMGHIDTDNYDRDEVLQQQHLTDTGVLCLIPPRQKLLQQEEEEERRLCRMVLDMTLHTAAVALVICGDRAVAILDHVEQDGKYEEVFLSNCRDIRARASCFLQKQEELLREQG